MKKKLLIYFLSEKRLLFSINYVFLLFLINPISASDNNLGTSKTILINSNVISTDVSFNKNLVLQQQIPVTGTVTDEDGNPLLGVTIIIDGTSKGTATDLDGKYKIEVQQGQTLIFSFLGFNTEKRTVGLDSIIDLILKEGGDVLDEVMIVAYGKTKKSAFTGSAASISADELATPAASFDKALDGKVAGVQVISNSGQPGSGTTFRIRGSGSLKASNEPLFVIDGVPMNSYSGAEYSEIADANSSSGNILSSINPNDIESITVLKDAAAAALYGSRAANGVVLITTKTGRSGKAKVNINTRLSWSSLSKAYETMNSSQYYKQLYNGYLNSGESIEDAHLKTQGTITHNPYNASIPLDVNGNLTPGTSLVIDTDWQDEIFKTSFSQDYDFNISGGTEKSDYYFSIGYSDVKGIAPNSSFERYSGRIKANTNATDWLNAGMNIGYSNYVQKTTVAGSAGASPLYNSLTFPNGVPVYIVDPQGNPVLDESGQKQYNFVNPVSLDFNPLAIPFMDDNISEFYSVLPSFHVELTFFEGLTFKTVFSAEYLSTDEGRYWNKEHGNGPAYNGRIDKYHHTNLSYTFTNTLNYDFTISEDHDINVLAGTEFWKDRFQTLYAGGRDLLGDMKELAGAAGSFAPYSDTMREALISYFGRVQYSYDDKYNISGSIRTDGSSIFGKDYKWGTFWSVGGSWLLHKEEFLANSDVFNELKLRLSYGTSGNKSGLDRYQSLGLWRASSDYQYGPNLGVGHEQLENALLKWEKQAMFNVGVDFRILNNRIIGSIDYFYKNSDGLLYDFPLALSNGFESITLNAARTANSGFEFNVGGDIIDGDFRWNAVLNSSIITDKIKDLNGDDNVIVSGTQKIWSIGSSQYEFYMPTWAGVNSDNGDPLWYKTADDGTRTTTNLYGEATYERQGKSTPDVYGSLSNSLSYKNFDLSIQMNFTLGGKLYDGLYKQIMHDGNKMGTNLHIDNLNSWTSSNQNTDIPKFIVNNSSGSSNLSSRYLFDATNFKIRNITLGYTFSDQLSSFSDVLNRARIWVSVDNLKTWFSDGGYKGYDDIDIFGVQGYRQYPAIPVPTTLSFGASLTF